MIGMFFFVVSTAQAQTQKWALGFKVGEPTGVSLRKYGDRNGLDISVGTYTSLLKSKKEYKNGELGSIGIMFNGTYFWYVPMMNEKMIAYGGLGVQINSRRLNLANDHTNNISTGPSITGGLEFFSGSKPTSYFIEVGSYLELLPKIFYLNPNLNVGIRHNF